MTGKLTKHCKITQLCFNRSKFADNVFHMMFTEKCRLTFQKTPVKVSQKEHVNNEV